MNATQIKIDVFGSSNDDAIDLLNDALASLRCGDRYFSKGGETGNVIAAVETITVPDDDETDPPFGAHIPHPVTAAEAGL